jgi:hypothetical protein
MLIQVSECSAGCSPLTFQLIVHAFDSGQAFHRILGQGLMGLFGDRAGQGDNAVLGHSFDGIVLEVGFEHVGLGGGGLDAAVRVGGAQRCAGD